MNMFICQHLKFDEHFPRVPKKKHRIISMIVEHVIDRSRRHIRDVGCDTTASVWPYRPKIPRTSPPPAVQRCDHCICVCVRVRCLGRDLQQRTHLFVSPDRKPTRPTTKPTHKLCHNQFQYAMRAFRTLKPYRFSFSFFSRILVGAPLGHNLQPNTSRSGALFKCPITQRLDDCEQVITDGRRGNAHLI